MKTKPLNGIGPGDKGPTDYLKERAELRRIAQASRKLEQMREDCLCVMPGFAFIEADNTSNESSDGG